MATSHVVSALLCLALMAAAATATQFRVGGAKGWAVPDGTTEPYNTWAARMRFQIGDQLLFVYPKETDSVLLVDQAAYNACNTTAYVTKFEGGSTVVTLDRSGPFFFISGNQPSCAANQKLIVVVLAASHTPPGLAPTPTTPSMPPTSAAPLPSPPSMTPPSAAPMPSPMSPSSPPSMMPPSAAPMPSPMSPPSMFPPSATPMPSPMSPPSGTPMPTPESAPSPTGSAPTAAPAGAPGSSPGTPGTSPPSSSPGTPGGAPQPPADTTTPPGPDGANSTTPGSGAAPLTAGLISTLAAGFGYALLAV